MPTHLILGGAVNGRRLYGTMPDLAPNGANDAGWGQVIPAASVDQYLMGSTNLPSPIPATARQLLV